MSKEKKIAIIDHVGSKAGMDYYTGLLAGGMKENGADVIVISNFMLPGSGIRCYPYFIGHTSSNARKAWNHFAAFIGAGFICRNQGFKTAVVHLFSYELKDVYALRVLKLFGIKVTGIVHDVESFANADSRRVQERIFGSLTEQLVVHNRFSYDALIKNYGAGVQAKTKIIPHGNFHSLYTGNITKDAARKHFGWNDTGVYLLFFGQIKEVKGLEILLRALPLLPDKVHLVIAGKPWKNDFTQYQSLIDQLGIADRVVKYIGFVEDGDRDLLFTACDLLILPYKQIFQSGVMLMAMSYQIPVVASDLEPMKELITDGETGFLFRTEDEVSLANVVRNALSNAVLLQETAQRAYQQTKEKNDWIQIAKAIIEW